MTSPAVPLAPPAQGQGGRPGEPGRDDAREGGPAAAARDRRGDRRGPARGRGHRGVARRRRGRRAPASSTSPWRRGGSPAPRPARSWRRASGYGAGSAATPQDILLEFVSVNPTGPPHVGHARQAAYGDSLGRILEFAGHRSRASTTSTTSAARCGSSARRWRPATASWPGAPTAVPKDGYHGDYVVPIAAAVREEVGDRYADEAADPSPGRSTSSRGRGEELMLEAIRRDLERFRVRFDRFFSERDAARGRARRGGHRRARGRRRRLPGRGRGLVPHQRLRRREGPRAGARRRRDDLPRGRRRLPPRQGRRAATTA